MEDEPEYFCKKPIWRNLSWLVWWLLSDPSRAYERRDAKAL